MTNKQRPSIKQTINDSDNKTTRAAITILTKTSRQPRLNKYASKQAIFGDLAFKLK